MKDLIKCACAAVAAVVLAWTALGVLQAAAEPLRAALVSKS